MRLFSGIQTFLAEAGENACYTLCLIDVALEYFQAHKIDKELDIVSEIKTAVQKKYISYNWTDKNDNNNFYVQYPALFLEQLTGKKWIVRHDIAFYKPEKNEYVINRYERQKTGYVTGHFEREDFKPICDSLTVRYGQLKSTRVCKVLN